MTEFALIGADLVIQSTFVIPRSHAPRGNAHLGRSASFGRNLLVPTLRVGMRISDAPRPWNGRDAERQNLRSHAERGNE